MLERLSALFGPPLGQITCAGVIQLLSEYVVEFCIACHFQIERFEYIPNPVQVDIELQVEILD